MPSKRRNRDPTDPAAVRDRALRAVARREHGARELQRKLVRNGAPDALAEQVVGEFTARGWQSDERYAHSVARARIAQGYGPLRIRAELDAAGVEERIIADITGGTDDETWLELARQAFTRHFQTPPASAVQWQKAWRFLAQHGFSSEHIRRVLKESGNAAGGLDT